MFQSLAAPTDNFPSIRKPIDESLFKLGVKGGEKKKKDSIPPSTRSMWMEEFLTKAIVLWWGDFSRE